MVVMEDAITSGEPPRCLEDEIERSSGITKKGNMGGCDQENLTMDEFAVRPLSPKKISTKQSRNWALSDVGTIYKVKMKEAIDKGKDQVLHGVHKTTRHTSGMLVWRVRSRFMIYVMWEVQNKEINHF